MIRARLVATAEASEGAIEFDEEEQSSGGTVTWIWQLNWVDRPPARYLMVKLASPAGEVQWALGEEDIDRSETHAMGDFDAGTLGLLIERLMNQHYWMNRPGSPRATSSGS